MPFARSTGQATGYGPLWAVTPGAWAKAANRPKAPAGKSMLLATTSGPAVAAIVCS
jgi:hypothetical protein